MPSNSGESMVPAPGQQSDPMWERIVFGRNPRRTLVRVLGLVATSVLLFRFVLIPIRVSGFSMYPTYRDGRVGVVNHLAYRWKKPQRGDVIAFYYHPDNAVLLKRVVGMPGETVQVVAGHVWVDGKPLSEPYVRAARTRQFSRAITLAKDQYFVIGDNRANTFFTRVQESEILGKLMF